MPSRSKVISDHVHRDTCPVGRFVASCNQNTIVGEALFHMCSTRGYRTVDAHSRRRVTASHMHRAKCAAIPFVAFRNHKTIVARASVDMPSRREVTSDHVRMATRPADEFVALSNQITIVGQASLHMCRAIHGRRGITEKGSEGRGMSHHCHVATHA